MTLMSPETHISEKIFFSKMSNRSYRLVAIVFYEIYLEKLQKVHFLDCNFNLKLHVTGLYTCQATEL